MGLSNSLSLVPRVYGSRVLHTLSVYLGISATTKDAGAAQHFGDDWVGHRGIVRLSLLRIGAAGYGGEEVAGEGRGLWSAAR